MGMGQLLVEGGEPKRNLERAVAMAKEAAEQKCDFLLLPECLDFAWTHPSSLNEAQPIPGRYSDLLAEVAVNHGLHICAGLTERADGRNYNTAILIDSSGNILLKYRKINLLTVEHPYYEIGTGLMVADTKFGRIGVNICSDNYIDALEIGNVLGRMGAQIILTPSSWTVDYVIDERTDPYGEKWVKPFSVLARLFDLVIVSSTSVGYIVGGPYEGKKMVGCSLAVGAEGILSRGTYNEFAGELVVTEFEVPLRKEKGTEIGEMLKNKGYKWTV